MIFAAAFTGEGARAAAGGADPFVCQSERSWSAARGAAEDLRVVGTEVVFHPERGFAVGEGEVVAAVASDLPGAQEVLEVRTDPPASRVLDVDGTTVIAWDYAGMLHRGMHFVAVALVRRSPATPVTPPAAPTFGDLATLAGGLRDDALLKAGALGEHQLNHCQAFDAWAHEVAGPPPYTDQLQRITARLKDGLLPAESKERVDDLCSTLRSGHFSEHTAQVLAVMALRQVGAPAYGLQGAGGPHALVSTYVDGEGWISLETAHPERGFTRGGSGFVARTPLMGPFDAARDGFWYPTASAYRPVSGETRGFSSTKWLEPAEARHEDATVTFDHPLAGGCR